MYYPVKVKYRYGSGNTNTSAGWHTFQQVEGRSETAVMAYLKKLHHTIKNLQIMIEDIQWLK